jgi:hypothetical protein
LKFFYQRTDIRFFVAAIVLMGLLRFVLTVSGLPDSTVKFFSMTVIINVGTLWFALKTNTHAERFLAAYLLIFPYMVVEVAALGYTWASGRQTIFHAPEYNLSTPIWGHTIGHLLGGLTWEPWAVFLGMEMVWVIASLVRRRPSTVVVW